MNSRSRFRILVFATAFACLMFELIIARVADFHLGFKNSYLAIPITFLGLALGSLHVHFRARIAERFNLKRNLSLLAAVCVLTIGSIYLLFTSAFPVVPAGLDNEFYSYLLTKTAFFTVGFIIPFYFFGRILTVCYHLNREQIGSIYSADFFGAALGCFLTPMLFHFVSLPEVITVLLGAVFVLLLLFNHTTWRRTAILALLLAILLAAMHAGISAMEKRTQFRYYGVNQTEPYTHEIASRWNEFSRVQLVEFQYKNTRKNHYKIIHDNARSNVNVKPYTPGKFRKPAFLDVMELPFILGRPVDDVLVMFAGCGAEMIEFNEYTSGKAQITGVEINALCPALAAESPELAGYHLAEFYRLPNIDLRIEEGRSFLMRNQRKFDVIYVGSSAPLSIAVTGHTRKYLYTEEAFQLYLSSLKPGGIIVFDHQPVAETINTFKRVFAQMNIPNFENCMMVLGSHPGQYRSGTTDLAFSPGGFTKADAERLAAFSEKAKSQMKYVPFATANQSRWAREAKAPVPESAPRVIDDHPYVMDMDFANYRLWPSEEQFKNGRFFLSWIKITTLLVICFIACLFILLANLSRKRRLPPSILGYLLLTGFCYLLVEVAYIAKLELFLQNPLVSMACVISIFLLTSGVGSLTYQRVAARLGMRLFPFLVAGIVAASIIAIDYSLKHFLGLPLPGKLLLTAALISPAGLTLGMFYPYAVDCLVRHDRGDAVPITYGISTLSSVIGATYAMSMMIQAGFNHLLLQGVAGYLLLGAMVLIYSSLARRNMFA